MYETNGIEERVILVGIEDEKNELRAKESIDELSQLAKTAGATEVGRVIQNREQAHRKHYLGKGKVYELKELLEETKASGIICDDELTNTQQRELGEMLGTKIMDRTMVILDIFAKRANTKEGSVQVELAQLKYGLAHLAGRGIGMSRLGGGIGTRGPGEKKLEVDRRRIRERISELKKELKELEIHRRVMRENRQKNNMTVISLVGYTNAGKSTLMNTLTEAGVLAEDKLFATLGTTTRKIELTKGENVLITDTVGFIQKLPHGLIEAFKATLEEMRYSDILVHVVDSSSEIRQEQMQVVYRTLKEIKCVDKKIITVFNKMDKEVELPLPADERAETNVRISALEKEGINELVRSIEEVIKEMRNFVEIIVPYTDGNIINELHKRCEILKEEHREEGTYIELYADEEIEARIGRYRVRADDGRI